MAGQGRCERIGTRAGQHRPQCARRDARRRRDSVDQRRECHPVGDEAREQKGNSSPCGLSDTGTGIASDSRKSLRPVLHDQAGRKGQRAWAVAGPRLRSPIGRHRDHRKRTR